MQNLADLQGNLAAAEKKLRLSLANSAKMDATLKET